MSMIGYYLRADENTVSQVRDGGANDLLFGDEAGEKLISSTRHGMQSTIF